jgi:glycosyltransferase involved in cell wall biosynthesis
LKTILVGHLPPPITGQSEALTLLIKYLKDLNFQLEIIDIGSHIDGRQSGKFSTQRASEIAKCIIQYLQKIIQPKITVVYLSIGISGVGFFRDIIFIWLAYIRKVRIILQLHGGGYKIFYSGQNRLFKLVIKNTLVKANTIIVLSSYLVDEFDFLPDYKNKLQIIHNTANVEKSQLTFQRDFASTPLKILYMSNLIVSKGYLDLLESAKYLTKLDIEITFCGNFLETGNEQSTIQNRFMDRINDIANNGRIKFLGVVSGDKKWEIFKQSHIFVLPTYYKYEGQPISIIEALAFRMPIITTNYRSMQGMVVENFNGFFVDPKSPEQIAMSIRKLYNDREMAKSMGIHSFEIYEKDFSPKINQEKYLKLFREII